MNSVFNLVIFSLIFIYFSNPAQAYLDPGTGSFLFQIIVGGVLSALFAIKLYFRKIKSFFSKKVKPEKNEQPKENN